MRYLKIILFTVFAFISFTAFGQPGNDPRINAFPPDSSGLYLIGVDTNRTNSTWGRGKWLDSTYISNALGVGAAGGGDGMYDGSGTIPTTTVGTITDNVQFNASGDGDYFQIKSNNLSLLGGKHINLSAVNYDGFVLRNSGAAYSGLFFQNSVTGSDLDDGGFIGINASASFQIGTYDIEALDLFTSGSIRSTLKSDGQWNYPAYSAANFTTTSTDYILAIDSTTQNVTKIRFDSLGSDDWGTQVVASDATLSGEGTSASNLKVDTTLIATQNYVDSNDGDTQLTQEQVEDFAFDPLRHGSGTQSLITVAYDDANNQVDYTVEPNLSNYTNDAGFLTSGDNWGAQVIASDATLTGSGITGDELKVDTTTISTKWYVENIDTNGMFDPKNDGGQFGVANVILNKPDGINPSITYNSEVNNQRIINTHATLSPTKLNRQVIFITQMSRGSLASPTNIVANHDLFSYQALAYQSGAYRLVNNWGGKTGSGFGTGNYHGVFFFQTVSNGSTSRATRFTLDGDDIYFDDLGGGSHTVTPTYLTGVNSSGLFGEIALGTDNQVFKMNGTVPNWETISSSTLTQEEVEDFAFDPTRHGSGTQSLITVAYDDANNQVDYTVEPNLSNYTNDAGFLTSEVDGSVTNEAFTIDADDADTEVISNQTVKFQGGTDIVTDYDPATNILDISYNGAGGGMDVWDNTTPTVTDATVMKFFTGMDVFDVSGTAEIYLDLGDFPTDNSPEGDEFVILYDLSIDDEEKIGIDELGTYLGVGGEWTRNGSDIYPNNTTDIVGIGTINPTVELHIVDASSDAELIIEAAGLATTDEAILSFKDGSVYEAQIVVEDGSARGTDAHMLIKVGTVDGVLIEHDAAWSNATARTSIQGGFQTVQWQEITASLTLDQGHYGLWVTTSGITVTMPAATTTNKMWTGIQYKIVNDSGGTITLDAGTSDDFIGGGNDQQTITLADNSTAIIELADVDGFAVEHWFISIY